MQFQSSLPQFHAAAMGSFASQDSFAGLGDLGAPRAKKKKSTVSAGARKKVLDKYRWLRDEDRQLALAFEKKLPKEAAAVFKKLARMRDSFRKKAMRESEGRRGYQIAARIATIGVSELARLINQKGTTAVQKKAALKTLAKADACDMILRYWAGKFKARAQALKSKARKDPRRFAAEFKAAAAAARAGGSVEGDGSTADLASEPGDLDINASMEASKEPGEDDGDGEGEGEGEGGETAGFFGLSNKELLGYGAIGVLAGFLI